MTKIYDLMSRTVLESMIEQKFIKVQPHPDQNAGLWVYNYSETAMFAKEWNEATEQCRGLITDLEMNVIARPWRKFFNHGERPVLIGSHDPVEITDKADGSLGIGYPLGEEYAVATRGSFQSDQAKWATSWLRNTFPEWRPLGGYTPLWEIVYPENRIVLDYGGLEGLILLGCVEIATGNLYGPYEAAGVLCWPGVTTAVFPEKTMAEFISGPNANRPNAEGVVIRTGWRMIKLKQDDYVRAHAIVTGMSNRSVWEALRNGEELPPQAEFMPDEFFQWLMNTAIDLAKAQREWKALAKDEYSKIVAVEGPEATFNRETRKEFAAKAVDSPFAAALFKMYDGQSIEELAWMAVKPVHFERPFSRSEDNT